MRACHATCWHLLNLAHFFQETDGFVANNNSVCSCILMSISTFIFYQNYALLDGWLVLFHYVQYLSGWEPKIFWHHHNLAISYSYTPRKMSWLCCHWWNIIGLVCGLVWIGLWILLFWHVHSQRTAAIKRVRLQELILSVGCLSFTWKDCFVWEIIWAFQPCDLPRSPWIINLLILNVWVLRHLLNASLGVWTAMCSEPTVTSWFMPLHKHCEHNWYSFFFRSAKLAAIKSDYAFVTIIIQFILCLWWSYCLNNSVKWCQLVRGRLCYSLKWVLLYHLCGHTIFGHWPVFNLYLVIQPSAELQFSW